MLRAIIERPVSVLIATLAVVVIGFVSLLRLPVSLLPTLERPRLTVLVRDDDRSREDLLYRVAEPLERRFLSLDGVVQVRTTVDDSEVRLVLDTEWQTDVDRLRIDSERRLAEVSGLGLDELSIVVETGDSAPVIEVAVTGGASAHGRAIFADRVLIPELAKIDGAGEVRRVGGALRRAVVRPYAAALMSRGLSVETLVRRLESVGQTRPAGTVREGGMLLPLVVREPIRSIDELAAIRLDGEPGIPLRDVARVALEQVDDDSVFRLDGADAVLVQVFRASGANAVTLARDVRQAVTELETRQRSDLRVEVIDDASREVVGALAQLGLAGLVGLVLGTVVLRLLLGTWRPTLALTAVVPASAIATFGAFYFWGVSLDVVALAGLALAIGMLIDNGIVVLEAIESEEAEGTADAVVVGTEDIALALVASFLTTAVVFLPLLYLQGLARAFFGVQAFAIVTSLGISLVFSLTLTPVLARLSRRRRQRADVRTHDRRPGRDIYLGLLAGCMHHRGVVVALGLIATVGFILLALARLPRELVPAGRVADVMVDFVLAPGLDQSEERRQTEAFDTRLRDGVAADVGGPANHSSETIDGRAGSSTVQTVYLSRELFLTRPGQRQAGAVRVALDPAAQGHADPEQAERTVRSVVASTPGLIGEVRRDASAFAAALERSSGRFELAASASTPERARRLAERAADHLATALDVHARPAATHRSRPALDLRWDALRLAELDANPDRLAAEVRAGLGGFFAGQVEIDNAAPEILVESALPEDPALLPMRVGASSVAGAEAVARSVPLSALATLESRLREPALERRDGRPSVSLWLEGPSLSLRPDRLQSALDSLPLAADERLRLAGRGYELVRSFGQLRLALGLGIVLVFLTIAAIYESLILPLVVMATVPAAAAGGLTALLLTAQTLNVMSFLGLILLTGIVVNNSIVLVHRIEQRRRRGMERHQAVMAAAGERYRPILTTTITTLLGMLPLAMLAGEGVELRRALAISVSGGLITGLLASLLLVPVLYVLMVPRQPGSDIERQA